MEVFCFLRKYWLYFSCKYSLRGVYLGGGSLLVRSRDPPNGSIAELNLVVSSYVGGCVLIVDLEHLGPLITDCQEM